MDMKETWKKIWKFLKADTWASFLVDLVLAFLIIKFIFFPLMTLATGSAMPLVIVESCSMYHSSSLEEIMKNPLYSDFNLSYNSTKSWSFKNGFAKGDIIFVKKPDNLKIGDVIIFASNSKNPIIHRLVSLKPLETKGDHNLGQLIPANNPAGVDETKINQEQLIGKALFRIPFLGWVKLIFFEFSRPQSERGMCN